MIISFIGKQIFWIMKSICKRPISLRQIKQVYLLALSLLFFIIYIPHIIIYFCSKRKSLIDEDVKAALEIAHYDLWKKSKLLALLGLLHTDSYFRVVFYHRIGIVGKTLIGWYRPGYKSFTMAHHVEIGGGMGCYHPFATVIDAKSIGKNFRFRNNTTIGYKGNDLPTIGDNVTLGPSVIIIGPVHIGNNAVIGAGSVVVKDVPDNAIVAGNPARIIRIKD